MSFADNLSTFGNDIAVIDSNNNYYSYSDLAALCNELSEKIASPDKQLICILCENRIEPLIAYLASLRTGNAAMLVDAGIHPSLLEKLFELYSPDYIWRPSEENMETTHKLNSYKLIKSEEGGHSPIHRDLCLLLSTSGTTGSPKFVRLTEKNIDHNAGAIAEYLKLNREERPITTLPMHYSYGLSVINSHLSVGATLLLTGASLMTRSFWDFLSSHSATSFSGVPYTYEILKQLKFFKMDLPGIRTMTQAGGRLEPDVALEFADYSHKNGVNFYIMYGQTEAAARISYLPPERNLVKYNSIGIPVPGGELSIMDNKTGEVVTEPFTGGELVYKGKNVMMGYADSRKDLAEPDRLHGVLKTGDIAYFDNDGYYYITGRKRRFIKIFGNRVNLDEIEAFLREEGINGICGGRDDLLCIAYTKHQKQGDIKKMVSRRYGFHHSVVKMLEINKIKRNQSGKVMYDEIFKRAGI